MQIIETSYLGVRSAFFRLEGGSGTPAFCLFPMVHIGEQAYYDEVNRRLEKCDLILYEGVKSRSVARLTYAYRSLAKSPRLRLVTQDAMKLDHLADRLVHADVSGDDFESRWSKLGLGLRGAAQLAAPIVGLYWRHLATRQAIATYLGLNLLKSRDEILLGDNMDAMNEVLVTWRDQHLIEVVEEHRRRYQGRSLSIALVFGAEHMRAVIRHLTRAPDPGYRVASSEWMMVFTL